MDQYKPFLERERERDRGKQRERERERCMGSMRWRRLLNTEKEKILREGEGVDEKQVNERQRTSEWEQKEQKRREVKDVGGYKKNQTVRRQKEERKPAGCQRDVQGRVEEFKGWC